MCIFSFFFLHLVNRIEQICNAHKTQNFENEACMTAEHFNSNQIHYYYMPSNKKQMQSSVSGIHCSYLQNGYLFNFTTLRKGIL